MRLMGYPAGLSGGLTDGATGGHLGVTCGDTCEKHRRVIISTAKIEHDTSERMASVPLLFPASPMTEEEQPEEGGGSRLTAVW